MKQRSSQRDSPESPPKQPTQDSAAAEAAADLALKTGDWQVYKYYFLSLGRLATILFTLATSGFVFFYKFPGIVDPDPAPNMSN